MSTFPPSLEPHQYLIRDFLDGPIDREKTESLLRLAIAAERTRCAEIARDYDCLGIRVTRIIARRIRKGIRPLTKAERRELAAGAEDDR